MGVILGGVFVSVWRIRGALHVMWGAVGFVEVATCEGGVVSPVEAGVSPFEVGQGSELSS